MLCYDGISRLYMQLLIYGDLSAFLAVIKRHGRVADRVCMCRPALASMYSGVMEGSGEEVAAWLTSPEFEQRLFTSFPCTNIIPSRANQVRPRFDCSIIPHSMMTLLLYSGS